MAGEKGPVLFVATTYSHLANFHMPFIRDLRDEGYLVHLAAADDGPLPMISSLGFTCWELPFRSRPTSIANLTACLRLLCLLREYSYKLVHAHTPVAAVIARLACRLARVSPVLYTAHGFHFFKGSSPLAWLLYFPVELLTARWTDALITINDEDYNLVRRYFKLRRSGCFYKVAGVGVDVARYRQLPRCQNASILPPHLLDKACIVTYPASLKASKNHSQLLRAWKLVRQEHQDAYLLLAGDGPLSHRIRAEVDRLGLEKSVLFAGHRSDMPLIYATSTAVAFTSRREGLPRAILEAMACGLPLVATDVRGVRDLVKHNVNGLLVKVGDIKGTARAIVRILSDKSLADRLGRAARRKAMCYDIHRVRQEMGSIYNEYLL